MTPLRALLIAIAMVILFAGSNMWTKYTAPQRMVSASHTHVDTTSVLDEVVNSEGTRDDWAEPRVDLNGNEIDDAVGDYRVDRQGEMYESHSPDTALLHLASPRM